MTQVAVQLAFDEHKDAIYRFAWRMAGPDFAEDIAQDVFLTLLRHPERFDPTRGTLRAFLLGVARNLALKCWRDAHRWEPLDDAAQSRRIDGGVASRTGFLFFWETHLIRRRRLWRLPLRLRSSSSATKSQRPLVL